MKHQQPHQKPLSPAGLQNPTRHIMSLLAGAGQSPIYNETFNSMESGACALGAGLLQPQTGRPVTKHCTAQGLTTTTATGTDIRNTASVITTQTLLNTVSIAAWRTRRPSLCPLYVSFCALCLRGSCALFPCREDISRALTVLRYSGRPVEGAASRAAPALRVF